MSPVNENSSIIHSIVVTKELIDMQPYSYLCVLHVSVVHGSYYAFYDNLEKNSCDNCPLQSLHARDMCCKRAGLV